MVESATLRFNLSNGETTLTRELRSLSGEFQIPHNLSGERDLGLLEKEDLGEGLLLGDLLLGDTLTLLRL